jgi:hypothetical protein
MRLPYCDLRSRLSERRCLSDNLLFEFGHVDDSQDLAALDPVPNVYGLAFHLARRLRE